MDRKLLALGIAVDAFAKHELHRNEGQDSGVVTLGPRLIDLRDPGMVQPTQHLCLMPEPT